MDTDGKTPRHRLTTHSPAPCGAFFMPTRHKAKFAVKRRLTRSDDKKHDESHRSPKNGLFLRSAGILCGSTYGNRQTDRHRRPREQVKTGDTPREAKNRPKFGFLPYSL